MGCPDAVKELVEKFALQIDQYRSPEYNETQVRIDFINPLFSALGWDMDNIAGYAEPYRDVVHEDAIRIEGNAKAPDYSFRIGGARKFFLEAKKPSINIKDLWEPAYQLRRYAWTAKLPLSILTSFREFAIYDTRVPPKQMEKASVARVNYITFAEFCDRWDEIASIFSKEAILKGAFDRYVESKGKRGTAEFDDQFLEEIEDWRTKLAHNLALRNGGINERDLNFSVQRIIDRVIFLRICEARGTERFGQLQALLNGETVYPRLTKLFRDADDRYNSGLFHFQPERDRREHPDELTPGLEIDDATLKHIVRRLYYPDSPYAFSAMAPEILGNVYERFLGSIIELTPAHRAKVEPKPEVRKAGGVFYTPQFIVDFIVRNTLGKLLDGQTPDEAKDLKIVDPACGSGSFLLGAYQYLLNWHHAWYLQHDAQSWCRGKNAPLRPGLQGHFLLTTKERKRILLDNIFGVDIDYQAVEVTQLSLLLKVLEDESTESINALSRLFHERALPDLADNIKCGNSLIGTDIYNSSSAVNPAIPEDERINAFDWDVQFKKIFLKGGFDAVIGNPPYIRMEMFKPLKDYLKRNYKCHDERSDLYAYFVERGHRILKRGGRFGMIVSNKFVRANYGGPLREFLCESSHVETIADFAGLPVFPGATVRTLAFISLYGVSIGKTIYAPPPSADRFASIRAGTLTVQDNVDKTGYEVARLCGRQSDWNFSPNGVNALLLKLETGRQTLQEYCEGPPCMGVKSGLTDAFVIDHKTRRSILKQNPEAKEILKPFLNGRDVRRYRIEPPGLSLIYTFHGVNIRRFPAVERHLKPFKPQLEKRATQQNWYELQQPQLRFARLMDEPKIVFPDIATEPRFALDDAGHYGSNTIYFIPRRDLFLLGLLNSRVSFFFFRQKCAGLESKTEIYLRFFGQYLEGFPVAQADASRRDTLISLVNSMISLQATSAAKSPHDREQLDRRINTTSRRIDRLVYDLYGLSDNEIELVENATT